MVGQPRRGFTVLEIVLVMAILVITTALAIPVMDHMMASDKLNASLDMTRSRLSDMRALAKENGQDYKLVIQENSEAFQYGPAEAMTGGADTSVSDHLPGGAVFKCAKIID